MGDYDIDSEYLYVDYYVRRPIRNIDLVIASVENFTDWEMIHRLFQMVFTHGECNLLSILIPRIGLETNDFGTDIMRRD